MTKVKPSVPPARHIPQRTCVACRRTGPKREMVRVVCASGSGIDIDLTGKKSGRGAYLCQTRACWENALNTGRLEYALRTGIKPEDKDKLVNFAKGINNTNR
jgi:predicted RNA-binding protein YlxR (DUF448 family)